MSAKYIKYFFSYFALSFFCFSLGFGTAMEEEIEIEKKFKDTYYNIKKMGDVIKLMRRGEPQLAAQVLGDVHSPLMDGWVNNTRLPREILRHPLHRKTMSRNKRAWEHKDKKKALQEQKNPAALAALAALSFNSEPAQAFIYAVNATTVDYPDPEAWGLALHVDSSIFEKLMLSCRNDSLKKTCLKKMEELTEFDKKFLASDLSKGRFFALCGNKYAQEDLAVTVPNDEGFYWALYYNLYHKHPLVLCRLSEHYTSKKSLEDLTKGVKYGIEACEISSPNQDFCVRWFIESFPQFEAALNSEKKLEDFDCEESVKAVKFYSDLLELNPRGKLAIPLNVRILKIEAWSKEEDKKKAAIDTLIAISNDPVWGITSSDLYYLGKANMENPRDLDEQFVRCLQKAKALNSFSNNAHKSNTDALLFLNYAMHSNNFGNRCLTLSEYQENHRLLLELVLAHAQDNDNKFIEYANYTMRTLAKIRNSPSNISVAPPTNEKVSESDFGRADQSFIQHPAVVTFPKSPLVQDPHHISIGSEPKPLVPIVVPFCADSSTENTEVLADAPLIEDTVDLQTEPTSLKFKEEPRPQEPRATARELSKEKQDLVQSLDTLQGKRKLSWREWQSLTKKIAKSLPFTETSGSGSVRRYTFSDLKLALHAPHKQWNSEFREGSLHTIKKIARKIKEKVVTPSATQPTPAVLAPTPVTQKAAKKKEKEERKVKKAEKSTKAKKRRSSNTTTEK